MVYNKRPGLSHLASIFALDLLVLTFTLTFVLSPAFLYSWNRDLIDGCSSELVSVKSPGLPPLVAMFAPTLPVPLLCLL